MNKQTSNPAALPPSIGGRTPPSIATLVFLAGTSVMAMNICLPVLPMIAVDLGVSDAQSQYVLTFYLAMTAVAQLIIGPLSDRYGRRPLLLISMAGFFVGSLVCTFAPTFEWLIFGRLLQTFTAAAMVLSRAIVRDLFDRAKAASMMGYITMAMALMPMLAPSIGGFLGETYSWREPFAFTAVAAALLFTLVYFDLGETHQAKPSSFTQQLKDYGELLLEPMVWGYFLTASLAAGAYFAFLGGASFVGLKIVGMGASELGLHFALVAIGYMFGNFLSGRYSERMGIELMMLLGGLVASTGVAISLFLMSSFIPEAAYLFFPMMLVGVGNGMTLPNANAGAISVRPDLAGSASGLGGFLQIGGGALLAMASGHLISVENQAIPLYLIMLLSSAAAALIALLMYGAMKRKTSG